MGAEVDFEVEADLIAVLIYLPTFSMPKIEHPMPIQADETPAVRCHPYRVKHEQGPPMMMAGFPTILEPCKKCVKAGAECTSSKATTPPSCMHTKSRTADSSSSTTKKAQKQNSPEPVSSLTSSLNALGSFSSSGRPVFIKVESTLTDPALALDAVDFDLGAIGGESEDHFNTSSAGNFGLLSPDRSHTSDSAKYLEAAERTRHSVGEDMGEKKPAVSDSMNISPTESLARSNDHSLFLPGKSKRTSSPSNPLMETLNRLGELQLFIIKELSCISKENLAGTFLSADTELCQGLRSSSQDKDLVGKVLTASERLINILTSCGRNELDLLSAPSPSRSRSGDLSGSKRRHSSLLDEEEPLYADVSSSSSFRFSSSAHLDLWRRNGASAPNVRPPLPQKGANSARSDAPIYINLLSPAKLTLLACHVSLLGVYRSILGYAFEILRTPLASSPPSGSRTARCEPFHTSTATPHSLSAQISTSTILGFRIKLEKITHT